MKLFRDIIPATKTRMNRLRMHRATPSKQLTTPVYSFDLTRNNLNRPDSCSTLYDLLRITSSITLHTKNNAKYGTMITGINDTKHLPSGEYFVYYVNGKLADVGVDSYRLPAPGVQVIIKFLSVDIIA